MGTNEGGIKERRRVGSHTCCIHHCRTVNTSVYKDWRAFAPDGSENNSSQLGSVTGRVPLTYHTSTQRPPRPPKSYTDLPIQAWLLCSIWSKADYIQDIVECVFPAFTLRYYCVIVLKEALQTETEFMFLCTGSTNRHSKMHFYHHLHQLQLLKLLKRSRTRSSGGRSTSIIKKFSIITRVSLAFSCCSIPFRHQVERFHLLRHVHQGVFWS